MLWYNAHSICVCRDSRRDIYYGFLRGKRDCARSTQAVPSGTVMNLFYESVHTPGCGDYTENQFCAWALLALDAEIRQTTLPGYWMRIAEDRGCT